MKKILTLAMLAAASVGAGATTTHALRGVEFQVDTLFHNQIGPSTTQTSLWFHNDNTLLRVFYTTMDMTNPYLSLGGVCATDHVAGNETISGILDVVAGGVVDACVCNLLLHAFAHAVVAKLGMPGDKAEGKCNQEKYFCEMFIF